jgi:hypothetical protein
VRPGDDRRGSLGHRDSCWLCRAASNTVLEAVVPYAPAARRCLAGPGPEQYCSETTALAMAAAPPGSARAARWAGRGVSANDRLAGLGCTASLARFAAEARTPSGPPLALQTADENDAVFIDLVKGLRDRNGEEQLVSSACLQLLLECGGGRRDRINRA